MTSHYKDRRPRILYIEDEDVSWEIVEQELERRFHIEWARTAREAFKRLAQNDFHLILMDIHLSTSEIDGIEIARILKRRTEHTLVPEYAKGIEALDTPIIFVTAFTSRYSRSDILSAGGEELLLKPVNFLNLSLLLARIWGRGRPPSIPPPAR